MSQNNSSEQLNNLSLTFYGFHLINSLNYGEKTILEADQIWKELTKLGDNQNIPELQNIKSKLICYFNEKYKPELENEENYSLLPQDSKSLELTIPQINGLKIKGFLSPFRLHDTYAIDLTLNPENTITPKQLQNLNLCSCLKPNLGQSLLLYAETKVVLDDDYYLDLANTCLNQLFLQANSLQLSSFRDIKAKGSLLNCPIFAYDNEEINPLKHHHVIIWFNPNSNVPKQIDQANEYFLYLFWSRHKILYTYDQSRVCITKIQKRHTEIEQQINDFSQIVQFDNRLERFKALLSKFPLQSLEYSQLLQELSDHQNTIKANKLNYRNLIAKLEKLPYSDSNFLQPFLQQINYKFQPQLKTDLSFFSPANTLFDKLINNIRGIVAIDQIENDRQFQKELQRSGLQFQEELQKQQQQFETAIRQEQEKSEQQQKKLEWFITLFGTGLAVSSISSAIAPELGLKIIKYLLIPSPSICITNDLAKSSCSALVNLIFHIGVGGIFAFLAAMILWLFQNKNFYWISIILIGIISIAFLTLMRYT